MAVAFAPSQLSFKHDTSPINFRISPLKLLRSDLELVLFLLGYLPLVIIPFRSKNPRSELNLRSLGNIVSIILQGLKTVSRIIVRAGIAKQGLPTRRGIAVTACVGGESLKTSRCVVAACTIVMQRRRTSGRVLRPARVIKKRHAPDRRVVSGSVP